MSAGPPPAAGSPPAAASPPGAASTQNAAATPTCELRCQLRPGRIETFRLKDPEVVIGREPGLGVTLPADGVSRRHAKITLRGDAYWIENLSPAGTFLNVHRDRYGRLAGLVGRPRRLRHLDVITLARSVELLFLQYDSERPKDVRFGIHRAVLVPQERQAESVELGVGETVIGRSPAANVVLEPSVVSSLHACIERDAERLVLRDLDSANGTFVNDERVTAALLRDGDLVSFANVARFRVVIETGEVGSGEFRAFDPGVQGQKPATGVYSQQWKTRYEWNSAEMQEIAELRAQIAQQAAHKAEVAQSAEKRHAKAAPAKPAAAAKASAPPKPAAATPAPKPATPAKPAPAAHAEAPAKVASEAKPAPAEEAVPAPPAATSEQASASAPPAPPAAPEPTRPAPAVPTPSAASETTRAAAPIREVRLTVTGVGPEFVLAVDEPGAHELGRAGTATLVVDHPTVSRQQARILLASDRSSVTLEPQGKTTLDGVSLESPRALADGSVIGAGVARITVAIDRGARAQQAPPPGSVPQKPAAVGRADAIREVLLSVKGAGPDYVLTVREPGGYELGRIKSAPLFVDHPSVSRNQARIVLSADRSSALVEPGAGTTRTLLDGAVLESPRPLADGSLIQVGRVRIEVRLERGSA